MGLAKDEAGNIWQTDAQGNAISMVTPARSGGVFMPRPEPKVESNIDYIVNPDGSVRPRPGGPKDPHAAGENQTLSPEALDAETTNWILTGKMSPLGMGGGPLRVQIQNNRPILMKRYGITENQLPSIQQKFKADSDAYDQRVKQGSFIQQAEQGALQHAEQIKGYLRAMPAQGNMRALNALSSAAQRQFSGETVTNLDATIPLLKSEIAKIMTANPSGSGQMTDDARHEFDILEGNTAPARKIQALDALLQMARAKVKANDDEGKRLSDRMTGGLPAYAAPTTPSGGAGLGGNGAPGGPGGNTPNGGNDLMSVATGGTRTEQIRGPVEKHVAAMFASGASASKIKDYVTANAPGMQGVDAALSWRALNPKYKGGYDVSTERVVPTTALNQVMASPLATTAVQAANSGTGGLLDEIGGAADSLVTGQPLSDTIAAANLNKQMQASLNPKSALAGNVLGGAAAMLGGGAALKGLGMGAEGSWLAANPIKAAALGDTAYSTAYGAGENNDNRLAGAGVGALVGPVASFGGSAATKALGSTLRGVVDPAVLRLRAAGVPLTFGEVAGGPVKKLADATTGFLGNPLATRYMEGRAGLSNALFNEAGGIVGKPVNAIGAEGIQALKGVKDQAYKDALDPVSLNLNTPQFIGDTGSALDAARAIPEGELPQGYAGNMIEHYIGNMAGPDGVMNGANFQKAYRGLAQTAAKAAPKVEGHDVGQALGQAKDALATALEEQNPGAYDAFLKANKVNRHLEVLANAVEAAKNQVPDGVALPTPAQFNTAASQNATRFGSKVESAMGNKPFFQMHPDSPPTSLISDAQQVMSNKIPTSGTSERLQALALMGALGAGTGGAGYAADGGEGAGMGVLGTAAAMGLFNSKVGQQALTAALLKRIAPFRKGGQALIDYAPVGGALATGFTLPTGQ